VVTREGALKSKDLLSIADLSSDDIRLLISNAADMKTEEKPSLRTRLSFEIAMRQLGGQSLYMSPDEVGLGSREPVPDVARVLSRYADAIAARTFAHETLEVLSGHADVPVINALSDREHPCQALADLLTIYEKKDTLEGLTIAYVGDGNNVASSLLLAASLCGINLHIASPQGYGIPEDTLKLAGGYAAESGAGIFRTEDPAQAVSEADIVYTDVWTSMGQETEAERRRNVFAAYQVNERLLSLAKADAMLMHPLPAHHGEEVAEGILYGPQSVVFDQAENRMHLQKALLAEILGGLEMALPDYQY
jgi:ornithine carbamoyltransferase